MASTVHFCSKVGLVSPGAAWDAGKLQERLNFLSLFSTAAAWICRIKDASLDDEFSWGAVANLSCQWGEDNKVQQASCPGEVGHALSHLPSAPFTEGETQGYLVISLRPHRCVPAEPHCAPTTGCCLAVPGPPVALTAGVLSARRVPMRVTDESSLMSWGLGGI